MGAVGGGRQRSVAVWYISAVLVAAAIAAGAYYVLVIVEQKNALRAAATVEKLEEQVSRARGYLARHQNDAQLKQQVDAIEANLKRRIPYGPIDVTVGSYIDAKAKSANIEDLRWAIQGGIKPPSPAPKPELDRLALDPAALKSSTVDVSFTARYKDALKFIRSLSVEEEDGAVWPIEIISVEFKRPAPAEATYETGKVNVRLFVRYFFQ